MEKLNEIQNQENEWSVYLLSCDKTPKVVYIGITNEKYVITRLFRHFVESVTTSPTQNNELKNEWVKANWQDIRMTILEHNIFDTEIAREKESNYVFDYIQRGYNVLNKTYTPIRVFDKYGNFYKDYSSYTIAAKEFNVKPCRVITCCSTGNRLLGEYIIKKYDPNLNHIIVDLEKVPINKEATVMQYDLSGNLIKKWNTAYEVSKAMNIDRSQLTKCLKGKQKTAKGFIWKYENENFELDYTVYMYDSNLNLINKFHSNKDCAKYLISNNYTSGKLSVVTSSISQSIRHNKKYLKYVFTKIPLENQS